MESVVLQASVNKRIFLFILDKENKTILGQLRVMNLTDRALKCETLSEYRLNLASLLKNNSCLNGLYIEEVDITCNKVLRHWTTKPYFGFMINDLELSFLLEK